ncbi:hypothetical protein DYH09_18000 [bacterium CPR1]|nr:hypothetical protein [bacterium CPR1]
MSHAGRRARPAQFSRRPRSPPPRTWEPARPDGGRASATGPGRNRTGGSPGRSGCAAIRGWT